MNLGKKQNASVFQNTATPAEKTGNPSESVAERFANLQFGPDVDILNSLGEPDAAPICDSRSLRAHGLFFTPEGEGKDFPTVLAQVQEHISENYSTLITGDSTDAKVQMKRYIQKFLQDNRISVGGMAGDALADALYTEMAEFGFLTKYIFGSGIEEIDSATRS